MELFWIVVTVIAIAFVLLILLPKFFDTPTQAYPIAPSVDAIQAAKQQKEQAAKEAAIKQRDRAMLEVHFTETQARETVPEDFPRRDVGACPYSKENAKPLPIANVPMCVATSTENMYMVKPVRQVSSCAA
jgi:hypothetical protein